MVVASKRLTDDTGKSNHAIRHSVFYHLNPANPNAAGRLMELVCLFLVPLAASIKGVRKVELFQLLSPLRDVNLKGFELCLNVEFDDITAFGQYMEHPDHLVYCRLLFVGWMISTSSLEKAEDRVAEAVERAVLLPLPPEQGTLVKDPTIPDVRRVWDGEQVADMQPLKLVLPGAA